MKQDLFDNRHREEWTQVANLLDDAGRRKAESDFPRLYRMVCQHLALARSRHYSRRMVEFLNGLVLHGHQRLYGSRAERSGWFTRFLLRDFPVAVRGEKHLVLVAAACFFGPLGVMIAALQFSPELIYTILDPTLVAETEASFRSQESREADSDVLMFAYYVYNNTSIGFRSFAGGLLFGLGSIASLLYNGLVIGALAGHLTRIGVGESFWSFVAGHSSLELTAVVLSGAAGLRLGLALLAPGRDSRLNALRRGARTSVRIVGGAAVMFVLAAVIEAFWSALPWVPPQVKYAVGAGLWLLTLGYLALSGRRHGT